MWDLEPLGSFISQQDRADIKYWVECTRVGKVIPGTQIIPCKTPFEGDLADKAYEAGLIADKDWFGKDDLLNLCWERGQSIGLVIDLVYTSKYYTGFDDNPDIEYQKIKMPGHEVPPRTLVEKIFDIIDDFTARKPDEYIAVHCTHGLNRTGFVVAAYLMTRANIPKCRKAVAAFEKARGRKMDKIYLLEALLQLEEGMF